MTDPLHPIVPEMFTPQPVATQPTGDDEVEITVTSQADPEVVAEGDETATKKAVQIRTRNYIQSAPVYLPMSEEELEVELQDAQISIYPDTESALYDTLQKIPNFDMGDTPEGREWKAVIEAAGDTHPYNQQLEAVVEDESAMFTQKPMHQGKPLTAAKAKFNAAPGKRLSAERLVLAVRNTLGMGTTIQLPLWHSGFWVTLKPMGEDEILELAREMASDKVIFGRATYGLLFANSSVIFANRVINRFLNNIVETTLKETVDFRQHIRVLDLQQVAWALARTIWPNGFPYSRSELDDKGDPLRVIRQRIDVSKISWVNDFSLNEKQRDHMAKRFGQTMTTEDVMEYQASFNRNADAVIELADGLSLNLKVPSIYRYLESGQRWVNGLTQDVDSAFNAPKEDTLRNKYIVDQSKASRMQQYSHFVDSITFNDNIYNSDEEIDKNLAMLSSNDEFNAKFFTQVRKFIEQSTISIVAVTSVNDFEDRATGERFPKLIPIDAMSTFFQLVMQRVARILSRG